MHARDGTIRISTRVRGMPGYVLDYVVLHELAHLLVPGHGKDFWTLVGGYPRTERARGYLEGVSATAVWARRTRRVEAPEADGIAALEVGSAE